MARPVSSIQWPPGSGASFDDIFDAMTALKQRHYSQHTARDAADPFVQLQMHVAALAQNERAAVNRALANLDIGRVSTRRGLLTLSRLASRPLRPLVPARGTVLAKLKSTPVAEQILVTAGQRIAPVGYTDPVFSVDEDITVPLTTSVAVSHWDASAETLTSLSAPFTASVDVGDAIEFGLETLAFDSLNLDLGTPFANNSATVSWEFQSSDAGRPTAVVDNATQIRFNLSDFLLGATATAVGLSVTVSCTATGVAATAAVELDGAVPVINTPLLGQTVVDTSVDAYSVTAEWRPIPARTDGTTTLSADGSISFNINDVFGTDRAWWAADGFFRIRARLVADGSMTAPLSLVITSVSVNGDYYVTPKITQGVRTQLTLAPADGTAFQHIPLSVTPIEEPLSDTSADVKVNGVDWRVVSDFSRSDSEAEHAVLRETPVTGWNLVFGNGELGVLPTQGSSVVITIRTGSVQAGNLNADTAIRAIGGLNLLEAWTLFAGTSGYAPAEASTRASAMQVRESAVFQLALRQDSVVNRFEIETALSGGAPNRATFATADGRRPFSRAKWTTESAGVRQYRVIVVGLEDDSDGATSAADRTAAATWLNGTVVGTETVGGYGPMNTEAIVSEFVPRRMTPTISITVADAVGVRGLIDEIVREFFKPHARNADGTFRWTFGGKVPVAVLFGEIWGKVSTRTNLSVSVSDGTTSFTTGDSVTLGVCELPALSSNYDSLVNITVVEA
jgi:hypothetical protein